MVRGALECTFCVRTFLPKSERTDACQGLVFLQQEVERAKEET